MKNQNNNFDFKDLLTFGIFILALSNQFSSGKLVATLTFVFTFCK